MPRFGDRASLARRNRDQPPSLILVEALGPEAQVGEGDAGPLPERRPWHPPLPPQPSSLDTLFRPGTRYALPRGDDTGKVDVAVDPGVYQVKLAVVRFEDGPAHQRVAAGGLIVREGPVTTWELALRPGEDPRLLGDDEFYGFGVDTATACFHDAAVTATMSGIDTDALERLGGQQPVEVLDPGSGANLIAFESGWGDGSYPTWICCSTVACAIGT